MLFHDAPEHTAFRQELRDFLARELEGDWDMRNDRDVVTYEEEHYLPRD